MKELKREPGIIKSHMLIVLLLLAPILLNLLPENKIFTYSAKISAVILAILFRQHYSESLRFRNQDLILLSVIVGFFLFSNSINGVAFEPNILYNLFWLLYFRDQLWLRDNFLYSLYFVLKLCCILSIFFTFSSPVAQETQLSSVTYFVPLNNFLGLEYRQQGIFSHPNTYGLFSFLLLSISLICGKKSRLVWFSVGLFGLLISGSRTFQLVSLIFVIRILLERNSTAALLLRKYKLDSLKILYLCIVVYFIIQLSNWTTTLNSDFLTGRFGIWNKSLPVLRDNFFIGLGTEYPSILIQSGLWPISANSAHSLYFDGFLSGGSIGGSLMITFFYIIVRRIRSASIDIRVMFLLIFIAGVSETMFSIASFGVINLLFVFAFSFSKRYQSA